MGIGLNGYWTKWVLNEMGIRPNAIQTKWVLDLLGLDQVCLDQMDSDQMGIG